MALTKLHRSLVVLIFSAGCMMLFSFEPRKPYPVPLALVIPYFDSNTGTLDEVFITYGTDENEGWGISDLHDRWVKDTRRKSTEFTHKEIPSYSSLISNFEAQQLNRVCVTFVKTLRGLEKDLERENWDRCCYLDDQLALFLRGFYYLISAARRSREILPPVTNIADSLFNDSLKTDMRIKAWRNNHDHIIKLRISIKELVYQIEQWQLKDLANENRDMADDRSLLMFSKAYELFIRLYFNLGQIPNGVFKTKIPGQ